MLKLIRNKIRKLYIVLCLEIKLPFLDMVGNKSVIFDNIQNNNGLAYIFRNLDSLLATLLRL
jgi:hypothetical protein